MEKSDCLHGYEWLFDDADEPSYLLCKACGERNLVTARDVTDFIEDIVNGKG